MNKAKKNLINDFLDKIRLNMIILKKIMLIIILLMN